MTLTEEMSRPPTFQYKFHTRPGVRDVSEVPSRKRMEKVGTTGLRMEPTPIVVG